MDFWSPQEEKLIVIFWPAFNESWLVLPEKEKQGSYYKYLILT